jgi:hypothetical protein
MYRRGEPAPLSLLRGVRIPGMRAKLLFFFLSYFFFLDIFFIYISNAIPKVPYSLPQPCSPTHPLLLLGPGIPLYWGI